MGEPGPESRTRGGASQQDHLRPKIDAGHGGADSARGERERQIAQERQPSSGQGSGPS
jgi:hypothetical protein